MPVAVASCLYSSAMSAALVWLLIYQSLTQTLCGALGCDDMCPLCTCAANVDVVPIYLGGRGIAGASLYTALICTHIINHNLYH